MSPASNTPASAVSVVHEGRSLDRVVLEAFRSSFADDELDIDANFFERGGDSLQAMRLVHAISRRIGTQIPTDILFRFPTARELTNFLAPSGSDTSADSGSIVTLGAPSNGRPVFLVPALYPSPWVFLPLAEALEVDRPMLGLRSPELDWRRDVLNLPEMVTHYVGEIRRRQPQGPYSLIGYSFGGFVAFEIARRLAVEANVTDLILLDTPAPFTRTRQLLMRLRPARLAWRALTALAHSGVAGATAMTRWCVRSTLSRATVSFTTGALLDTELRLALTLVDPARQVPEGATLDELCATYVSSIRSALSVSQWHVAKRLLPVLEGEPASAVKAYKVFIKNVAIAQHYRPSGVFPGSMTVIASDGHAGVTRWQEYASTTVKVVRVPVSGRHGIRAHLSFLEKHNIALYAEGLAETLA